MISAETLLQKHWGFDRFRPFQKEIISSVLEGKDTLGLLPTGGGKSICYQIPALMKEGIVLVVSPLIALMQDQVAQLKQKKIPAMMLERPSPGQSLTDQLNNLDYGPYKILFLSPERLQNSDVAQRLVRLPIHLLAVDEAHCVSEWGPDFRPAFLAIKDFRERLSNVPLLALTASATPAVLEDMKTKLALTNPVLHRASFNRPNLKYRIEKTNDKVGGLLKRLSLDEEPCIVYCRTRNKTETLYQQLKTQHTVAFFHGGLDEVEKKERLESWLQQDTRIMVATLAFGMGIDKSNVRQVIHMSPPESIEHYYQETGRAGRDGKSATATLFWAYNDFDLLQKQFLNAFPAKKELTLFYKCICNHLQVAYGEGNEATYYFNFDEFCTHYGLSRAKTMQAIQVLDREGLWRWQSLYREKVSLRFLANSKEIGIWLKTRNKRTDFFQHLWRVYPRILQQTQEIDFELLANTSGLSQKKIVKYLKEAHTDGWLELSWIKNDSCLEWLHAREEPYILAPIIHRLKKRREQKQKKIDALYEFCSSEGYCKRKRLLAYFGEKLVGSCEDCTAVSCGQTPNENLEALKKNLTECLQQKPWSSDRLVQHLPYSKENIVLVLHEWASVGHITQNTNYQWELKKS